MMRGPYILPQHKNLQNQGFKKWILLNISRQKVKLPNSSPQVKQGYFFGLGHVKFAKNLSS